MTNFNSYAEMAILINEVLLNEFQKDGVDPKHYVTFSDEQQKYMDKIIKAYTEKDFETWFSLSLEYLALDLNFWKIPEMAEIKQACMKVVKDRDMMLVYWNALNESE